MAERENLAKSVDLEQVFSRRNPVVEGLLQTGGKIVGPAYDAASYGLNQLGIRTPSFEQATGIKPFGFGPGASGESAFFRSPDPQIERARQIQRARVNAMQMARQDMQQPNAMGGRPAESFSEPPPLVPQLEGESPAAYYIRSKAIERMIASDMRQPNAMGGPAQPSDATTAGLKLGNGVGDNNRERSFLERMAQSGLLSTLQGMARAERMYGVGPLAAFSESALDVQAARSAAEQEAAKRQSEAADRQAKIQAEKIKKSGPMQFKGPMIKSIEKAASTKQSLNAINMYLELLANKKIGGMAGKLEQGISNIGALFGAGGESGAATANSIRSQIITGLQMGVSQGQISKGDYEQLNNILSGSGWFVSNPKVEAQLQRLKGVLGGNLRTVTKILEAQGIDPSYFSPDAPSGLVSARRPAQ